MAEVVAVDLGGELSREGTLTHTLFSRAGSSARVGDVGIVTIKTNQAGFIYSNYSLSCTNGLALSADGVNYGSEGGSITVGTINSTGTQVYVKCVSAQPTPVSLILPQVGLSYDDGSLTVTVTLISTALSIVDPVVTTTQFVSVTADTLNLTSSVIEPTITALNGGDIVVTADTITVASSVVSSVTSTASNFTAIEIFVNSSIVTPTVSITTAGTTFNFYIGANGLYPTTSGVTATSWDSSGVTSITFTVSLFKVTSGGAETQIATNSSTVSNFAGDLSRNLSVSQTSLDPNGKLRLKISDGYSLGVFDYSLGGLYSQINTSTVAFNCEVWAYYDDQDVANYMGFSVGNPSVYRGVVSRLNNVILQ